MVRHAYLFSFGGHYGQTREDDSPYSDHPEAAAWIYIDELDGNDPRVIIDALLHDIPEETFVQILYWIFLLFGLDIALDVQAITKNKGESVREYLCRIIARGPWLILAKLCDRLHNLCTLSALLPARRLKYLNETREHHLPLLIPALRAYGEPWAEYAQKMECKINEAMAQYE